MIFVEQALSVSNAQRLASKELVSIQSSNTQWLPLTEWPRLRTLASCRSAAFKITCKEVIDYSDEDEDAIVIASS